MAPRAMSHITSSIPSEPASRTYSMKGMRAAASGSLTRLSRKRASHSLLMRPARALQLVGHSARTENDDAQILREGLHRLFDGLAEVVAAVTRRRRILNDIDRQGNNLARPLRRLTEHQGERYGQAVVDIHLVDDGQIELIQNHGLRDMARQHRIAFDHRHRARAPAFVRRPEFLSTTECEGRNELERERGGVVV